MARIRTIKPEFWTSEQVMDCKPVTRLLFIGLWNFVDDYGRAPVAPRTIKAQVMPGDDVSGPDVQDMLNELNAHGLILFYSAGGKEYFEITGWAKHQKIDNPSKYKVCPAPFTDQSPVLAIPSEELPTIGLEGKGEDKERKEESQPVAKATRPASSRFDEFWKEYPKRDGDNPRKPAEKKFNALVKTGVDPDVMIAGARQASSDARTRGIYATKFVPQAIKWLNDQRFLDCAAASFSSSSEEPPGFYAKADSEQLEAWDQHNLSSRGKRLPRDRNGGWRVSSEWPPGYVPGPRSSSDPPAIPALQSM